VIWANTFNRFDPASPFGGYKESGYGREGGRHGLAAYLKPAGSARAVTISPAADATDSAITTTKESAK
jgi:acyl-CoA reductase-like NAD-dependent aldehyde dehydrogenase